MLHEIIALMTKTEVHSKGQVKEELNEMFRADWNNVSVTEHM